MTTARCDLSNYGISVLPKDTSNYGLIDLRLIGRPLNPFTITGLYEKVDAKTSTTMFR